jgi:hypothetical protein
MAGSHTQMENTTQRNLKGFSLAYFKHALALLSTLANTRQVEK